MDLNHNCTEEIDKNQQKIRLKCRELAEDFIAYKLGKGSGVCSESAKTLRRLSEEMEEKHTLLLNNLCHRLNITSHSAHETFLGVADEVFQGGVNWGRIAALYTFGGKLAQHFAQNGMDENKEAVTGWTADYISGLSSWIESHGGWEGFNDAFLDENERKEKRWWNGILLTTLGLGVVAMVLYIE